MPVTLFYPACPRRALSWLPAGPHWTMVAPADSDELRRLHFMGDVLQCALHPDTVREE